MPPHIALLLGRTVWTRDAGGWRRETFNEGECAAGHSVARLAEVVSAAPARRAVVVFEPEGIAHQAVETPKVGRAAFATLARVRDEHPVVASENLGWGIEYPEPGSSGAFSTLIHSELTPGLVHVQDACIRAGGQLSAAWSAYTAACACVKSGPSALKARFVLILTPEFAAVAACGGGKRSFKGWVGPMSERDWRAFSAMIGDFEARTSPAMAEAGLRRGSIVVVAEGEPERICPIWRELRATGRVEAIVDLEAFALGAARIPAGHPANLAEAFPRPRNLDRFLAAASMTSFSALLALGTAILGAGRHYRAEYTEDRARTALLEVRLKNLSGNQREMDRLRNEAPDGAGALPVGRHEELVRLASAIPDALTLTSLIIGRDGGFELEALAAGADFDPESARLLLARRGFASTTVGGWVYDTGSGRLLARGKYEEPQP